MLYEGKWERTDYDADDGRIIMSTCIREKVNYSN